MRISFHLNIFKISTLWRLKSGRIREEAETKANIFYQNDADEVIGFVNFKFRCIESLKSVNFIFHKSFNGTCEIVLS